MPSLGYLIDAPEAIAARTDPRNWPASLLVPTAIPVPDDFDTDLGPVLDQDGLSQSRGQLLRHDPGKDIGAAAGRWNGWQPLSDQPTGASGVDGGHG